jgi:hypothetical protein
MQPGSLIPHTNRRFSNAHNFVKKLVGHSFHSAFEALEQTLRLRLVSGPVDNNFFFLIRNSLSHTVVFYKLSECTHCQISKSSQHDSGDAQWRHVVDAAC